MGIQIKTMTRIVQISEDKTKKNQEANGLDMLCHETRKNWTRRGCETVVTLLQLGH